MRRFITAAGLIFASVTICLAATWPKKGDVVYMPVAHRTPLVVTGPDYYQAAPCIPMAVIVSKPGKFFIVQDKTNAAARFKFCGDWGRFTFADTDTCRDTGKAVPVSYMSPGGCQLIGP